VTLVRNTESKQSHVEAVRTPRVRAIGPLIGKVEPEGSPRMSLAGELYGFVLPHTTHDSPLAILKNFERTIQIRQCPLDGCLTMSIT
jgi:hypothetical protein